jgi:8-oxo-dGTP pyrophosphatase MutT (NUDIX family)
MFGFLRCFSRRPTPAPPPVGVGIAILSFGNFPNMGDIGDEPRVLVCLRGQLRTTEGGPGVRNEPHCWDLPGGGVEPSETPFGAVMRETREELGNIRLAFVHVIDEFDHLISDESGTVTERWINHTFGGFLLPDSPSPAVPPAEQTKLVQLRFVTLRELESVPITASLRQALPKIQVLMKGMR